MKYRYKLPKFAKIATPIICTILLATTAYYVLISLEAFGLPQGNLSINISGAIVCLLLFVLAVCITNINYKICGEYLCQKYLFADLLGKKVLVKNILNLVYKKSADKLYFSYYTPNAYDPIIVLVSIDKNKVNSFVNMIKQANPNVIYFEEE